MRRGIPSAGLVHRNVQIQERKFKATDYRYGLIYAFLGTNRVSSSVKTNGMASMEISRKGVCTIVC